MLTVRVRPAGAVPVMVDVEEMVLEDPFDYAAEDRLRTVWERALAAMPLGAFRTDPSTRREFLSIIGSPQGGQLVNV